MGSLLFSLLQKMYVWALNQAGGGLCRHSRYPACGQERLGQFKVQFKVQQFWRRATHCTVSLAGAFLEHLLHLGFASSNDAGDLITTDPGLVRFLLYRSPTIPHSRGPRNGADYWVAVLPQMVSEFNVLERTSGRMMIACSSKRT